MRNYFNYFTEIEEHFQRRRGSLLLLSTLDWALIETWREAGVPLEAVLRGIDNAFDKHDSRKAKARVRRVNGLAYCSQEVMAAVEQMKEAAMGSPAKTGSTPEGFEQERMAAYLEDCAVQVRAAAEKGAPEYLREAAVRLESLGAEVRQAAPQLEELEAALTGMEERLFATLIATTSDAELLKLRQQASSELAPYRSRMQTMQIRQVEQQFLRKRLLEKFSLPRLSLFYMSQS